ncbi:hypothetical protein OIU76_002579 [Salix suchowensis]|nr:hypothetical protein OIU76_002579 [Salix suchowensis]
MAFVTLAVLTWAFAVGGVAWKNGRNHRGHRFIPGPRGLPIFGSLLALSRGLAHRTLASMAWSRDSTQLMALSLGSTPVVVASDPHTAREILTSIHFADRPIKQSAKSLMFSRAIGFAPNGTYWRLLRRIASGHLLPPLNNIMGSVFGKRYSMEHDSQDLEELRGMVIEGFELLGAFNWCDYLPWLNYFYDPLRINERCLKLVPRVRKLVKGIIEEHRNSESGKGGDGCDFVDVLLSLEGQEKLEDDDMVAVLWEMIFRGTDTTALLTEWVMAEGSNFVMFLKVGALAARVSLYNSWKLAPSFRAEVAAAAMVGLVMRRWQEAEDTWECQQQRIDLRTMDLAC